MSMWKVAGVILAALFVLGALGVEDKKSTQQSSTVNSRPRTVTVSQEQFTGGTRDTRWDIEHKFDKIQRNYDECVADIRSGVSGVYNKSIACDRNQGRKH